LRVLIQLKTYRPTDPIIQLTRRISESFNDIAFQVKACISTVSMYAGPGPPGPASGVSDRPRAGRPVAAAGAAAAPHGQARAPAARRARARHGGILKFSSELETLTYPLPLPVPPPSLTLRESSRTQTAFFKPFMSGEVLDAHRMLYIRLVFDQSATLSTY
jgi:hypothetical protein